MAFRLGPNNHLSAKKAAASYLRNHGKGVSTDHLVEVAIHTTVVQCPQCGAPYLRGDYRVNDPRYCHTCGDTFRQPPANHFMKAQRPAAPRGFSLTDYYTDHIKEVRDDIRPVC